MKCVAAGAKVEGDGIEPESEADFLAWSARMFAGVEIEAGAASVARFELVIE